jgi:16S rRNA (guanine527-N7)-methyltransferase
MFHVKHEAWTRAASEIGVDLTLSQVAALGEYYELLITHAIPRGYIAAGDAERIWQRHILDGLRGAHGVGPGESILDIGSGAGIPGVPLAVALSDRTVTLCEPRRGRVAFLEMVGERLGLSNVDIVPHRVEAVEGRFDRCVARAFSSAAGTWEVAEPRLAQHGELVYWAGRGFSTSELADLDVVWRLSTPSDLADAGPLVIMGRQ